MATPPDFVEFTFQPDDPLAAEHAAICRWLEDALASHRPDRYWRVVKLKELESGRSLMAAHPEEARKLLLAALIQAGYWHDQIQNLWDHAKATSNWSTLQTQPVWFQLGGLHQHCVTAISALIRRLPGLERCDLINILKWRISDSRAHSDDGIRSRLTKELQLYAASNEIDTELREVMRQFATSLREWRHKELTRLATKVEQLCQPALAPDPERRTARREHPPKPSPAGNPLVLQPLKYLERLQKELLETDVQIGPDHFGLPAESPLREEHLQITEILNEAVAMPQPYNVDPRVLPSAQSVFDLQPSGRGRFLLAAAERHIEALLTVSHDYDDRNFWSARHIASILPGVLASFPFQFDRDQLFDFVLYAAMRGPHLRISPETEQALFSSVREEIGQGGGLTEGERYVLHLWRCSRIGGPPLGTMSPEVKQLTDWIGDGAHFYLVPRESWSDAVNLEMARWPEAKRTRWIALFKHLLSATSSRPSERWRQTALGHIRAIGSSPFRQIMQRWLSIAAKSGGNPRLGAYSGDARGSVELMHDENANVLRGLLWLIPLLPRGEELAREVASVALSAYKKVPGIGPRAVKVGNAAVYALSQMGTVDAVGQLAMLKVRVRFGSAQKEIDKAFDAASRALELPRDQIEEMSVPLCGLESVGYREETIAGYQARLTVSGSSAALKWFDGSGKPLKSVPAAVKTADPETLKELQQGLKDIGAMVAAQRDRLDALYLDPKRWSFALWRERYADHPLVGTIARRLIWCVGDTAITFVDGCAADIEGKRLETPDGAEVTLWHPIGRTVDEVVAWRRRIESLGIVQPFKQAHREVYLLTDAERRTRDYSNRFAAHILRQHQFNALCAARRWKNKLRLLVDDEYPPATRDLPAWGLRAEYWVKSIGEDFGGGTNDAGVFHRVVSDRVTVYRLGAATNFSHAYGGGYHTAAGGPGEDDINEPVPLESVPPIVLSEILRDVDLFVGVASVGNDPTWHDGGPGALHQVYWHHYSFGELSETAATRKKVLEGLIPRLRIAHRCSFSDRFLIVRGDRRTYKIHLGSGNILMEPNDVYLCIVVDSRTFAKEEPVYLPFEGDLTMSVILSKAFLLADDSTITDPVITRQFEAS